MTLNNPRPVERGVLPENPEVSVVIPVHNGGPLFGEQLMALSRQDFTGSWEVVVADNGSTDESAALAAQFCGRLNVRVVDASGRRGPAHARNAGAQAALGSWIAYCDADDIVDVGWLSALFAARGSGDVVTGRCDVTTLNHPDITFARGGAELGTRLPEGPAHFLSYAPSCNLLIQRDTLLGIGGWDESLPYCEDVDLSWRAQLAGHTLAFAPDAVVHYRFRGSAADLYRQMLRYKAAEPALFARYRDAGARRRTPAEVGRTAWWLVSRLPYTALGTRRRFLWCALAGGAVGRLQGSVRSRVFYP